ncbi:MAG TPA: ATP-binding protein [Steroidobacteraceae bacterium]|nr:ATP-binding protein [Steroidobacteraceae bacterium]
MSRWFIAVLYMLAYVALDWISYVQPVLKLGITPWSPQTGLTVAFLFWAGPRWAPCTALAAFLAEMLVRDATAGWLPHALASLWIAACYAGLVAMRPGGAGDVPLALASAVRFLLASLAAALVAATGYVGCFLLTQTLPWDTAMSSVARYWIGDVNGILMLAPLLLALPRRNEALRALAAGRAVAAVQALIIVLFVWLLFGIDDKLRFFYPLFVPMIWIAVRWGAVGALLAALAIQVGIVVAMREPSFVAPLIDLQILIFTLTVTGLLLGVAVTERALARSEAQERDRQLARAMRFAVAGEMASSLTHELNQPITALVSYLQAAQIMSAPAVVTDKRVAETLGKAANEAIRAAEVLRRLRDFYQGTGPPAPGPTDVVSCCGSVLELLEPRLRRQGVRVRQALPQNLPQVSIDRTQVEMVLHNLVSNAIDALAVRPPGSREMLLEARVETGQVVLTVEDSGPGVASDALGELFEPFNTTKPDGMGLGLAISRNLMRAHGGELSHRGARQLGGAAFELRLPMVQ